MKEQLETSSPPTSPESRPERTLEKELRFDVHKKIDELGCELRETLGKYATGERGNRTTDEITGNIWDMYDLCILFSEYEHVQNSIDDLEQKYPNEIERAFKDSLQYNPIPTYRLYKSRSLLKKHFERIRTSEKAKYLGSTGRNTGRSAEDYMDLLDITKRDIREQYVLDIGTGEGNFTKWAKRNGAKQIIGIEPLSEVATEETSKGTAERILSADWKNLPLQDGKFDRVVSVFAFPHWVHDWKEMEIALREIIRVVRKGGTINLFPGAPILEKKDMDPSTFKKWEKDNLDIPFLLDCIHQKEYENVLLRFADQVEVTFGEPRADFEQTSQVEYYPITLKKK